MASDIERGREYLRLLRRGLVRIRALSGQLIEPHGLTVQQFLALFWIRQREGLTQIELAAELDSDANTVSAMVRRLEAKGYVTRARNEGDGRAVRLIVTDVGRSLVEEAQPDVDRLALHLLTLVPDSGAVDRWLNDVADLRALPETNDDD